MLMYTLSLSMRYVWVDMSGHDLNEQTVLARLRTTLNRGKFETFIMENCNLNDLGGKFICEALQSGSLLKKLVLKSN